MATHIPLHCKGNIEDSSVSSHALRKKLLVTLNQYGRGKKPLYWSCLDGANYFCHACMDLCANGDFFFKDHSFKIQSSQDSLTYRSPFSMKSALLCQLE